MDGINHIDVFVIHITYTKQKCFSYNSNNNNIMIVGLCLYLNNDFNDLKMIE